MKKKARDTILPLSRMLPLNGVLDSMQNDWVQHKMTYLWLMDKKIFTNIIHNIYFSSRGKGNDNFILWYIHVSDSETFLTPRYTTKHNLCEKAFFFL